jgi:hypothetical protein
MAVTYRKLILSILTAGGFFASDVMMASLRLFITPTIRPLRRISGRLGHVIN